MILIVDFGSQYTQLLARRIRELGVYAEIVPHHNFQPDAVTRDNCEGVVLSGGPRSVYDENAPSFEISFFEKHIPVLGICYGFQLINKLLGGHVATGHVKEYGLDELENLSHQSNSLFYSLPKKLKTWMSHGDCVEKLADDLIQDSVSSNGLVSSFHHTSRPIFGLQFHPEVTHTECGTEVISNFLFKICNAKKTWKMAAAVDSCVAKIREQVPETEHAICALSGGVDSTVAAVLTQRAIGRRLTCFYIDTGLMRHNESTEVMESFKDLNLEVEKIDASELFISRLKGISDPEKKRKIIGHTFIEVFETAVSQSKKTKFLVQGTLYTDVIESISPNGTAVTIKSHHNVGGLPEEMNLKLIEPLREFFKDEVRRLGKELCIPQTLLGRHPFPGPGLSIRILGEVTREKLETLRKADAILISELKSQNLYDSVWQAFVVLLPIQSVGVMGDGRTYENACVIRCVNASDGMTATWSQLPFEFLQKVSNRITNEVSGINRVTYDITSKPPATIEWE